MKKLKLLWLVVKRCRADKILLGFLICFLISSLIVMVAEPQVTTFREGMWYTFVACTTIGFGDIAAVTTVGRIVTVVMTIYEIILVSFISAIIISYYLEVIRRREKEVLTDMLDKLERLPELSHEELVEISNTIKKLK